MANTSRNINQEVIKASIIHRREENFCKMRPLTHVFPFEPHSCADNIHPERGCFLLGIAIFLPVYIAHTKRVLMVA